jgi:hypothetical protein
LGQEVTDNEEEEEEEEEEWFKKNLQINIG